MSKVALQLPTLHPNQQRIKDEASRFNVECCGRRFGKNILCHDLVINRVLRGQPVAWGSPTYKNLGDDWRTLRDRLAPITSEKSEQDHRIETYTGGIVEMWSLDSPEPIRGRHYGLFVINEAASVKDLRGIWNEIIRATLIDLKGDAHMPSTPKGLNDYYKFYSMGLDPTKSEWSSFRFTSHDNPYIDPKELDELRTTMTEEAYKQEILAQFLEGAGSVFRNLEAVQHAPFTMPGDHRGHTLVAGVDWGKKDDFTVISIGCATCKAEVALDRFNVIDYYFQVSRVDNLIKSWDVAWAEVEVNSMGEPVFENLIRMGLPVHGFYTSWTKKAPLIENFALALERAEIQLLPNDVAETELEAYEYSKTQTGLAKYSAPEGMHDDTVIGRALMYRAMQNVPRSSPKQDQTREAVQAIWEML